MQAGPRATQAHLHMDAEQLGDVTAGDEKHLQSIQPQSKKNHIIQEYMRYCFEVHVLQSTIIIVANEIGNNHFGPCLSIFGVI